MTDESLGTYTFLPWFRRNAATAIATQETLSPGLPSHATLPVELTVNARTLSVQTRLYGPGDVIGLDPREVVRVEPQADSVDFPSNYFAAVDFAREDLPWLFTPLRADAQGILRPWIALIAVRRQPGVVLRHRTAGPLPVLELDAPAVPEEQLPDLAESWAWAHVQVTGTPEPGQTLEQLLEARPELGVARLICPQRLRPDTRYVACIVPAFRAGLQAGLGFDEDVADLAPAWELGSLPPRVLLPVYYHWEFSTSARADFESLARALRPRAVGPEVGQRAMDVGEPGPGLPTIEAGQPGRVLGLEGALRSPATVTEPWPDEARVPFEQSARGLLDPPEAVADPVIGPVLAPPLYGRWHALEERVPEEEAEPHWLRELNLDPRYRASAGLGTLVVQRDQEDLMEEAWRQIGDVVHANNELRRAQLARAVTAALRAKHLEPLPPADLLHVTRPVHARVTLSPHSLHEEIERSPMPAVALSGALRRMARPRGTLARRLRAAGETRWRSVPGRMSVGEIAPAGPRTTPDGASDLDTISDAVGPPAVLRSAILLWLLVIVALALLGFGIAAVGAGLLVAIVLAALAVGVGVAALVLRRAQARGREADKVRSARLTPEAISQVPARPDFRIVTPPETLPAPAPAGPGAEPSPAPGAEDSAEARRFRLASAEALERAQEVVRRTQEVRPAPSEADPALDLPGIAAILGQRLDPELTVVARVRDRIRIPPGLWEYEDPIEPVMAYPEFPRPTYEAVGEISEDFLIPGLEHVPPDTVTLLETNPPVIQALMVGLNHEMARELLFNEYETDQRGSYFRQFWDPRGRVPPARTDAERRARYDVPELHRWARSDHLGDSLASGEEHQLVLLIRGELLRRFPNAMVFAERAQRHPMTGILEPEGSIRWPLFRGQLPPDVFFLGFDLTEEEARGEEGDPGWYFVIQQQPTEPRFGLDEAEQFADDLPPPTKWEQLTWGHLAREVDIEALTYVHVRAPLPETGLIQERPDVAWGGNSAQMAFITLQQPVRVAIHAQLMLRPEESAVG